MLHINGEFKKLFPIRWFFVGLLLPELYRAASLDDFLRDKSDLKPTRWGLYLLELYGKAGIQLPWAWYTPTNNLSGTLSDLTSHIHVDIHPELYQDDEGMELLREGKRLYELFLVYTLRTDKTSLLIFDDHGSPWEEKQYQPSSLEQNLHLSPA